MLAKQRESAPTDTDNDLRSDRSIGEILDVHLNELFIKAGHREKLEQAINAHISRKERLAREVSLSEVHKILYKYGEICEEEGHLSPRAVTIRMDLSAYYYEEQTRQLKEPTTQIESQ